MNALPNGRHLVIQSTMQGLSLNNDKRQKTMNSHFLDAADSNIIQSSVTLEPSVHTLNSRSPVIKGFPLLSLKKHSLLVSTINLDNRLSPILAFNKPSEFITTVSCIGNNQGEICYW